jgi:predicted dehydrogenase
MKIGLVGYGKGGRYFHASLISGLAGTSFAGVVTSSAQRKQQVAADHPGVATYDSLADLAAAGVDVVAISTPLASRRELILEAIDLGLGVVSDKPFAENAVQARELVDAAERGGVMLSVFQNRRWDSDFLTVRKLIEEQTLGNITRFESSIERFSPTSVGKASGGGMLRDLGSHLVDQALVLFGPVKRVYAELQYAAPEEPLDHTFFVALTHANGVVSHLSGSCLQNTPKPRFRVSGSLGCYSVAGLDGQEDAAIAGLTPRSEGERWGIEPEERWGWIEQGEHRERVPSERGTWQEFYRLLHKAVDGQGRNPVDPYEAIAAAVVMDAARTSAEEGRVVTL